MKLVEEEELDLGVDLLGRVLNRGRYWGLKDLDLYVLEYPAFPIPCDMDELTRSSVIAAKLANCFC
jgi:hypothetical protein